jgi:curli biogenesis system outer membrane secretion channel CsgG
LVTSCTLVLAIVPSVAVAVPSGISGGSQDQERVLDRRLSNIPGPKRTVAVASFLAKSDFLRQYGLSDLGGGLAAMLATTLVESGQFIVVERPNLSAVLGEQELGANGLTTPESAPRLGNLIGAQLLILGNVTEFDESASGRSFSFGLGGGLGIGISPQSRKGIVGIDVRVVDTATGQVVAAYHVREEVKARAINVNVAISGYSVGGSDFSKTPLGKAAREAVNAVAVQFAEAAAERDWSGQVVDFEFGEVAINAGAGAGIQAGDSFRIYRVTRVLTDPTTGRVLGQRKHAIGEIVITEVDDNFAFGSFEGDYDPQRGDIVSLS